MKITSPAPSGSGAFCPVVSGFCGLLLALDCLPGGGRNANLYLSIRDHFGETFRKVSLCFDSIFVDREANHVHSQRAIAVKGLNHQPPKLIMLGFQYVVSLGRIHAFTQLHAVELVANVLGDCLQKVDE